ncbi:hypothetical protein [Aliikangiella sp. IMCC44632]
MKKLKDKGLLKYQQLLALVICLLLSACKTSNVKQQETANNIQLWTPERVAQAKTDINNFANSHPKNSILKYMLAVKQLDNIPEDKICRKENIQSYYDLFAQNSSSLIALALLISCEESEYGTKVLVNRYGSLIKAMLSENNGRDKANAVNIREATEIELILSTAGYDILDQELIIEQDKFLYRVHAVDLDSGEFEYHYYNNFPILKRLFSYLELSDKQITSLMLNNLSKSKEASFINLLTSELMRERDFNQLIETASKLDNLPPISKINLSRAYLYLEKHHELEPHVDWLVAQHERGNINASVLLAEIISTLDTSSEYQAKIDLILSQVDKRTQYGNGAKQLKLNIQKANQQVNAVTQLQSGKQNNQDGVLSGE